jgi:ketosteroid isomerase-like protein
VVSTLCDGSRVAFETRVLGTLLDQPFAQRLCLVFVVRDGRVQRFHEYLAWPGGLDPASVTDDAT